MRATLTRLTLDQLPSASPAPQGLRHEVDGEQSEYTIDLLGRMQASRFIGQQKVVRLE